MKTGIVSQHANVGPTNKNSATVESGRLNNYSRWVHYDFSDASTITISGSNNNPIDYIDDKGPREIVCEAGFRNTHPYTKIP